MGARQRAARCLAGASVFIPKTAAVLTGRLSPALLAARGPLGAGRVAAGLHGPVRAQPGGAILVVSHHHVGRRMILRISGSMALVMAHVMPAEIAMARKAALS